MIKLKRYTISIMFIIFFLISCSSWQRNCHAVFDKKLCLGSDFDAISFENQNYYSFKSKGKNDIYEIRIGKGNYIPSYSEIKNEELGYVFDLLSRSHEDDFIIDIYKTKENLKIPKITILQIKHTDFSHEYISILGLSKNAIERMKEEAIKQLNKHRVRLDAPNNIN